MVKKKVIEIPRENFGVHKYNSAKDAYETLEKVSSIHTAIAIGERNLIEFLIMVVVNSYTDSKYEESCGESEPVNWHTINDERWAENLLAFDFFLYNKATKTYYVNKMCGDTPIDAKRKAILTEIWRTYNLGAYALSVVERLDKIVSEMTDRPDNEKDFKQKVFETLYAT